MVLSKVVAAVTLFR